MANKTIYKINVINWDKYNRNLKKGHKAILISTGFLSDAKIRVLPNSGKLLYLGLLLRCGEVTSSLIEASHDHLVTFAGGSGQVVSRLLVQLEQLQLVTVEKIEPFINRIEKNRIEYIKEKETTDSRPSDIPASPTKEPENEETKKLAKEKKRDGALKIQEIWNQERKHLPECVILTPKRESSAAKRWDDFPDEDFWRETVRKVLESDFLSGRSGKFKASFDFLIRPDSAVKINEGAYDSNKPQVLKVRM